MSKSLDIAIPVDPDSHFYNGGLPRQCYLAAWRVAVDLRINMPRAKYVDYSIKICHGVVQCAKDGEHPGQRFLHAWTELTIKIDFSTETFFLTFAIDASNTDTDTQIVPAEAYYKFGKVDSQLVHRYGYEESIDIASKVLHFGPWRKPLDLTCFDWTEEDETVIGEDGLVYAQFPDDTTDDEKELCDDFVRLNLAE